MLSKLMWESKIEPDAFDDDKTLYPISTKGQEEFDIIYPLRIQQIAKEQLVDDKLIKEVK